MTRAALLFVCVFALRAFGQIRDEFEGALNSADGGIWTYTDPDAPGITFITALDAGRRGRSFRVIDLASGGGSQAQASIVRVIR